MLNAITNTTSASAPLTSGLDAITAIEILLVQDYDEQLLGLKNQIEGATRIKKAYRGEIEKLNDVLSGESVGKDDKYKRMSATQLGELNQMIEFTLNPETGDLVQHNQTGAKIEGTKPEQVQVGTETVWDLQLRRPVQKPVYETFYQVKTDQIEKRLEMYKEKLSGINEQSELISLNVQSITNQRKIAFETVSNLIRKHDDALSSIIRNYV